MRNKEKDMEHRLILGLMAQKQAGKSSSARFIVEYAKKHGLSARELSWATPLKDACAGLTGLPKQLFYGTDQDKNTPVGKWGILSDSILTKFNKSKEDLLTIRELLQIVGTEAFRNGLGKDIWVNLLFSSIENYSEDIFIISDCRFKNEVEAIKAHNGKVIRLYRNLNIEHSIPHVSELEMLEIPNNAFDYIIDSEHNVDLPMLQSSINAIMDKELQ